MSRFVHSFKCNYRITVSRANNSNCTRIICICVHRSSERLYIHKINSLPLWASQLRLWHWVKVFGVLYFRSKKQYIPTSVWSLRLYILQLGSEQVFRLVLLSSSRWSRVCSVCCVKHVLVFVRKCCTIYCLIFYCALV